MAFCAAASDAVALPAMVSLSTDVISFMPASYRFRASSIGIEFEHFEAGAPKDVHVQQDRPVVDVPKVEFDPVLYLLDAFGLAAGTIDLRPSGNARLEMMPEAIGVDSPPILRIQEDRMRARPDKRHVTLEDIQELWQFVGAGTPQEAPDPRDAWIFFLDLGDRFIILQNSHGSEFIDGEGLLVEAVAVLSKDDRPGTIELNQDGDYGKQRQQYENAKRRQSEIHESFERFLEPCHRRVLQPDHRHWTGGPAVLPLQQPAQTFVWHQPDG